MSNVISEGASVQLLPVDGESAAYAWRKPLVGKTGQVRLITRKTAQVHVCGRPVLWPVANLAPATEEQSE